MSEGNSSIDDLPLWQTPTKMHHSASWETVPMVLQVDSILLRFFFVDNIMWCHHMLCHFVPGWRWWNQCLSLIMMLCCLWQQPIQQLWKNTPLLSVCTSISSSGIQWAELFWYVRIFTLSWNTQCPIQIYAAIFLTVTCWFSPVSSSMFSLFLSVQAVMGDQCMAGWHCLCTCL